MDKPERILPTPDIDAWFTGPEESVDNEEPVTRTKEFDIPFTIEELDMTDKHYHTEPWPPTPLYVDSQEPERIRTDSGISIDCTWPWVAQRIVECVNAMAGITDPAAFVRYRIREHGGEG
jgi:hypothetical protein